MFTALNNALGFVPKIEKSEWGAGVEFLDATVCFAIADSGFKAHLSISAGRVEKSPDEIGGNAWRKGSVFGAYAKCSGEIKSRVDARDGKSRKGGLAATVRRGDERGR